MAVILAVIGALAMAFAQCLIFCYAPIEESMGLTQKIFYPHLALAWWALISFFVVFVGSFLYLKKRDVKIANLCAAAAEIGALFCALALLAGMIWAKKSWGVWWTWDPRLTTTLIMLFIYASYLALGKTAIPGSKKSVLRAVLGIVAFLDVPLVFLSARIFRSIHPAIIAAKDSGMEPEMWITALATILALGCLWLALLLIRKNQMDDSYGMDCLALESFPAD